MFVRDIMTAPVITVTPDTTVKECTQILEHHSITAMPVVTAGGELIGVISEADVIAGAVLPDQRAHELPVHLSAEHRPARVQDAMNHQVLYVTPQSDLAEAVDLMVSTVVKSLPVVEHGRVVGMISRRDVIKVLARQDDLIEMELDELVRMAGNDWHIKVHDGVVTVDGPDNETDEELAQVLASSVPGIVGVRFKHAS